MQSLSFAFIASNIQDSVPILCTGYLEPGGTFLVLTGNSALNMSKTGLGRGGMIDIAIAEGFLWETTSQGGRAVAESFEGYWCLYLNFRANV